MMNQRKSFRFNLSKLEQAAKGNAIKLVELLEDYYKGFNLKFSGGSSFLTSPGQLFFDRNTDILFKSQYIQLAARRSYQQYKDLGYTYLDLSYYPDLKIDAIKYNPLLTITENKLYFKYEE
jgi:hypothetical protein